MTKNTNWLKDCEICNVGLCATVNDYKREGLNELNACRRMSEESEGLYSEKQILDRYRYYTGKDKKVSEIPKADIGSYRYAIENLKHELDTIDLISSDIEKIKRLKTISYCAGKMQNELAECNIRLKRKVGQLLKEGYT